MVVGQLFKDDDLPDLDKDDDKEELNVCMTSTCSTSPESPIRRFWIRCFPDCFFITHASFSKLLYKSAGIPHRSTGFLVPVLSDGTVKRSTRFEFPSTFAVLTRLCLPARFRVCAIANSLLVNIGDGGQSFTKVPTGVANKAAGGSQKPGGGELVAGALGVGAAVDAVDSGTELFDVVRCFHSPM